MEFAGESLHFGGSAPLGSHESQPWEQDMRVEARQPERRASVSSEESDIEAPPVIARKVSFADAFGLDLVSVKEFDTWNTPTPAAVSPSDHSSLQDSEEYCLSHLFAVPSSAEELRRILQEQKVQLEHVELLPGTTSLRGTIRVLNLCFDKQVYARTTLDKWGSRFDLLAEFVPGSSDGETDRFSFMFSLMPPSEGQRGRVEFCLRYETTMGTFWDNNGGRNYVLFYDRRTVRDMKAQVQEELFQPNKKSCLKASRDSPADFHLAKTPVEIPDATGIDKDVGSAGTQLEEGQESEGCDWHSARRSRRRMARLVQLQDHFSRREAEPVRAITPEPPAVGVSPSESATPCPPGQCKSDEQAQSHPQATLPLGDADSKSRQAASMPTDPWESFLSIDNTVHATALEMATSSSPFLDLPPSCLQDVISQLDFSSRPPVLMENHEGCCTRGSDWHPLWGDLEVEICRVNTKGSYSGRDDRLLGHDPHVESESHEGSCSQTELYKEDADVRGSREQAGAIRGGDSNAQLNSAALPVGHLTAIAVDHFPVSSLMTPVTGIHCPTENDKAGFLLGGRRGASEKDEPADKIQNTAAKEEISLGEADDRLTEKDKIVSCSPEVAVREPIDNLVDISPGGLVNHSVKMAVDVLVNQSSDISAAELISNSTEISAEELVDKLAKISTSELVNHSAEIGADEKIDHSAEMTACELADNSAEISAVQLLHHSSEISADEHGDNSSEITAGELADNSAENSAVQLVHHSAEISADELVDNSVEITADELVEYLTEISASEQVDYSVKITPSEAVNHSDKMVVDEFVKHSAEISADELADNSAEISTIQLVHHSAEISADELVENSDEITTVELVEYLTEISTSEQVDYSVKITSSEPVNHSDKMVVDELFKHSAEISADEHGDHSAEITADELVDNSVNHSDKIIDKLLDHSSEISADELVDNSAEITAVELVHYSAEISVNGLNKDAIKMIPGNITSNQPVGHSDRIHPGQVIDHIVQCYGDHSEWRVDTSGTSQSATLHLLNTNSVERILLEYKEDRTMSPITDSLVYNRDCHTEMDIVNIPQELSIQDEEKEATRDEGDCGRSQANDPDERQQVDAYRLRDIEKVKRRMENASRGKEGGEVTRGRERSHAARETVVLLHAKGRGFLSTKSKGKSSDLFKAGLEDSMDAGKASYVGQDMGVEEGNLHSTIVSLPGNNELRVKDLQRQEERQPPASAVEGLPTPASTRCSARDWGDHMPCILTDEDAEDSQGIAVPFHLTLGTQKEPIAVRMSPEERAEAKNMGYMLHLLGIITPHHLTRTVLYVVLLAVLCVAVYQYGFLACFALYLCLACLLSHHREKQDLQERDRTKQSENKEYRP
ncbi:uncharacterized protein LOC125731271 isoform X6 [Brienomyrus brachyistius]|uniref:uncharacterized protein LOC125731271 isoform X6 n=1 Tax=Brienomyrus brachyistius TaxID=42636 RepID=UPI0020B388D8|nr:uncharacterized protein LOC125731271 isoform X6 [Brienomyrus brachyistius]